MERYKPFFEKQDDIKKGDIIKFGKWKNKSATVTGFGTDKNNQPTIITDKGEMSLYHVRIDKKMSEDFSLSDFTKHSGASDFTRDWIEVRRKIKGPGNKSAKLTSIRVNRKKDYITFVFKSKPTYSSKETAVDPSLMVLSKTTNQYTQMIRVLDFFKWAETKPGYKKYELSWKEIKEILEVASIQVWCNCGSFQFQGMNYAVSANNAAIYPEFRAPKRWDRLHGQDNYLCKHLSMIFNSISFFINPMASMVNKYLKQAGSKNK